MNVVSPRVLPPLGLTNSRYSTSRPPGERADGPLTVQIMGPTRQALLENRPGQQLCFGDRTESCSGYPRAQRWFLFIRTNAKMASGKRSPRQLTRQYGQLRM